MKNHLKLFLALIMICLFTENSFAQDGQYPLSSGKGIFYKSQKIETIIPLSIEPPRAVPPGDFIKDRKVFWVHGHGGGIGSWDRAAAATQNVQVPPAAGYPARKIISHRLDYSGSHNAISAAGSDIKTQIETISAIQTPTEKARNMVISHSLGGLVSQYADYLYDTESDENRSFYGLVTVGSPNSGAILSTNAYPYQGSKVQLFANDLCNALIAGPAHELVDTSFFIDLIVSNQKIKKTTQKFCDLLTEDVVSLLLKGFNTPIAADLKPTSAVVGLLSNHSPEVTRRVAFYGTLENQDMIWKTYHYMKTGPNAESPFNAVNSQATVDEMNGNKAKYEGRVDYWQDKADYFQELINFCWLAPPSCIALIHNRNECYENRNEWRKGVVWWNSANDKWRLIMGDLEIVPDPFGGCECTTYNLISGESWPSGSNPNCEDDDISYPLVTDCHWVTTYSQKDVESDGIIVAASAIALPGALKTIAFDGDSHFQLVNSPNLRNGLLSLWDGSCDQFFITAKR